VTKKRLDAHGVWRAEGTKYRTMMASRTCCTQPIACGVIELAPAPGQSETLWGEQHAVDHPQSDSPPPVTCDAPTSTMTNLDPEWRPVVAFDAVWKTTAADTGIVWNISSRHRHPLRYASYDVRDLAIGNRVATPCGARYRSSASIGFSFKATTR
jgi:hypothetical protein